MPLQWSWDINSQLQLDPMRPAGQVRLPLLFHKRGNVDTGQLFVVNSLFHLGVNSAFGNTRSTNEFLSSGKINK